MEYRTKQERVLHMIAKKGKPIGYEETMEEMNQDAQRVAKHLLALERRGLAIKTKDKKTRKVYFGLNPKMIKKTKRILEQYGWNEEWEADWK